MTDASAEQAAAEMTENQETEGWEAEEPQQSEEEQPKLIGAWHQLEGTPRPGGLPKLLSWNEHGCVAGYPDLLRIEVQRKGEERSQVITDYDGLNMASISEGMVCLAASSSTATGARVLLRPARRWEKAFFSAPLSINEIPEAVACGEDFVAVLTSNRFLRLYTFSGLPLFVLSMPGQSVALAASGALLLVITRSPGSEEDFDFRLLDTKSRAECAAGPLPLSEGSQPRWLGFTEDLVPLAVDTWGVVRALLGSGSWVGAEWTPVLSMADHEEEQPLWVVHATSSGLVVTEAENEPLPPVRTKDAADAELQTLNFGVEGLRTLPWRLPLGAFPSCGDAIEGVLRDQLLLRHMQAENAAELGLKVESFEKKCKSSALKLFAQLATSGEVERAYHVARFYLARMAGCEKVLDMACKLAESAKQYKLADEISALRTRTEAKLAAPLFRPGEFEAPHTQVSREEPAPRPNDAEEGPVDEVETARQLPSPSTQAPAPPTNPFARKRPLQAARSTRQPATPMASPAKQGRTS
ncbi:unnamed protein product [Effrenium voratum]|nr:unnamed protein product [Effrenium voratum]